MIRSRTMPPRVALAMMWLATVSLSGCGGGGGSAAPTPTPPPSPPATALPTTLTLHTPARTEPGTAVSLGSSLNAGVEGLSASWDFGDGNSSTQALATHTYAAPGTYEVTLTVRNSAGQSLASRATLQVGRFAKLADRYCSGDNNGWCWQAPIPSAEQVITTRFRDAQLGAVAGSSGYIQLTNDGGQTWSRRPRAPFQVFDLSMADTLNGWAIGADRTALMRTRDGGRTWHQVAVDLPYEPLAPRLIGNVLALDADKALVTSVPMVPRLAHTVAMMTLDGGARWSLVPPASTRVLGDGVYWSARPALPSRGEPLGQVSYTRVAGWGATSAAAAPLPNCEPQLVVVDSLRLWAHCSQASPTYQAAPTVFSSADGGQSWTLVAAALPALASTQWALRDVALDASGVGLAVLRDDTAGAARTHLLRVNNGARNWEPLSLPPALLGADVPPGAVLDARAMWLRSAAGQVHLSTNGGLAWQRLFNAAESQEPTRLTRDDGGGLIAEYFSEVRYGPLGERIDRGSPRRTYRSADNGSSWVRVPGDLGPDALENSVVGLWFFDAQRGLAQMADGTLRDSADGGRRWTERAGQRAGSTCCLTSGHLVFTSARKGWLVDRGRLLTSDDGGANWTAATLPPLAGDLVDLQFVGASSGWAASGKLLSTSDGGASWIVRPQPTGEVRRVRFASERSGIILVRTPGGFLGKFSLWRTADGGTTWAPSNFQDRDTPDIVALRHADANNVWMISRTSLGERVWRSGDAGATWRAVSLPIDMVPSALDFIDAQRGWLVGESGEILATSDGGTTWQPQAPWFVGVGLTSMFWLDAYTGWLGGQAGAVLATASGGR